MTLDRPLDHDHLGTGDYRGEIADLSRNVVVESADPAGVRGHTMYHRRSAGSISYAEFRHLGKEGVLGRYSLHYHLCGDTDGAARWSEPRLNTANRWLTIHGTNYLVVRDCVGYQSVGHGFFMEDGTEVYNVLDHNLAVQAFRGKPLPKQGLPFDQNEGAGFWWADCRNTFNYNVARDNDRYGFRFEATETSALKLTLPVMQPDGDRKPTDIRTLPSSASRTTSRTARGCTTSTSARASTASARTCVTRSSSAARNFGARTTPSGGSPVAPGRGHEDLRARLR